MNVRVERVDGAETQLVHTDARITSVKLWHKFSTRIACRNLFTPDL